MLILLSIGQQEKNEEDEVEEVGASHQCETKLEPSLPLPARSLKPNQGSDGGKNVFSWRGVKVGSWFENSERGKNGTKL